MCRLSDVEGFADIKERVLASLEGWHKISLSIEPEKEECPIEGLSEF